MLHRCMEDREIFLLMIRNPCDTARKILDAEYQPTTGSVRKGDDRPGHSLTLGKGLFELDPP